MKFISIILSCFPLCLLAQEQITVDESPQSFSQGTYNAYRVEIPEAKLKEAEKNWINYLKSFSKGKVQNINGEYSATLLTYKNISAAPFNVYSKLLETQDGVRLTAWVTPDDSIYISAAVSTDENTATEKFIRDFAIICYQKVVKEQLEESKSVQHKLESKLASAIKEQEENIKKISEDNRSIERNLDAAKLNERDQATQDDLLTKQKEVVETAKGGSDADALKVEEKRLKDYEGDLKKLVKENEKLKAAIDNWNKHIRDSERRNEQLRKDQEDLKAQIENQKSAVQGVQDKLNNIK